MSFTQHHMDASFNAGQAVREGVLNASFTVGKLTRGARDVFTGAKGRMLQTAAIAVVAVGTGFGGAAVGEAYFATADADNQARQMTNLVAASVHEAQYQDAKAAETNPVGVLIKRTLGM